MTTTMKNFANQLDAAAALLAVPCTTGVVLASGFSRLLERLAEEPAHHDVHDVEEDEQSGLPSRVQPDPEKPQQLKVDRMRPFGVVSAYRNKFSHKANMARSVALLRTINKEMPKVGAYKLIGHWQEESEEAKTRGLTYKEALKEGLISPPSKEESFLIVKPETMPYEEFKQHIIRLGKAVNEGTAPRGDPRKENQPDDATDTQDSVLVCDGEKVLMINPATGEENQIGTGLAASVIAKAYSRMRNKPEIPFVFAGTQQPGDNGGRYLMTISGLRYLTDLIPSDYRNSVTYSEAFKDCF